MGVMTNALTDYMAEAYVADAADEQAPEPERFRIDSLERANWASRVLAREYAAFREFERAARVEHDRIEAWLDGHRKRYEASTTHLRTALMEWHQDRMIAALEEAGSWKAIRGAKSVELVGATVTARLSPDSWDAEDPDAFVRWAKATHPELVKVTEVPRIADAKKVLAADGERVIDPGSGEVVPGLTVRVGEIKYNVEVSA